MHSTQRNTQCNTQRNKQYSTLLLRAPRHLKVQNSRILCVILFDQLIGVAQQVLTSLVNKTFPSVRNY